MRNIPDDNLGYSTLILLNSGHSGSGFQLNTNSNIFLVTAKHVLFDDKGQLKSDKAEVICQTRDINDDSTTVYEIDFSILKKTNNIYSHQHKDVAAFTIGTNETAPDGKFYTTTMINGVTIKHEGLGPLVSVAKTSVLFLKDVLVSNDIFLYGYPSSLGLKRSPHLITINHF